MSSAFADPWFPFSVGDYAVRSKTLHASFFDTIFFSTRARAILCLDYKQWRLLTFWGERFGKFSNASRINTYKQLYGNIFDNVGQLRRILESSVSKNDEIISSREVIRLQNADGIEFLGYKTKFCIIDRYAFVFLFNDEQLLKTATDQNLKVAVMKAIEFIDRGSAFFENIPVRLFSIDRERNEKLFGQYFGPHSFCPKNEPDVPFLWPWQRSVALDETRNLRRRSIATTSVVLDLRHSTTAMNLSRRPEKFSELINNIVDLSRREIVSSGGFFDKEIGDGVVGHFCDEVSSFLFGSDATVLQALVAATKIRGKIMGLFDEYQKNLAHGIGSFGPAIGLHNSTSVWLFSKQGIRAIGDSVVAATRLCENARAHEICVSNAFLQSLSILQGSKINMADFKRRSLKNFPEIRAQAAAFGYVYEGDVLSLEKQKKAPRKSVRSRLSSALRLARRPRAT